MTTPRVLVVYGSRYGQAAKVAERIRARLSERGLHVTVCQGDALTRDTLVSSFDAIVVGASLLAGRYQDYIQTFVRRNRAILGAVPSAFFAVSGSAASVHEKDRAEAVKVMEAFLSSAGWRPRRTASVAGAVAYTKYGPIMRWMMKMIIRRRGGPTDTSRDHEFTDWDDIDRFAADIGAMVTPQEPALTTG